jgi:5'-methylthioadenosine phosphorylase
LCYGNISLVTDYDAGLEDVDGIEPVTMETIFKVLEDNLDRLRKLLFRAIPDIPAERSCACGEGLGHLI